MIVRLCKIAGVNCNYILYIIGDRTLIVSDGSFKHRLLLLLLLLFCSHFDAGYQQVRI
jgi:hypothetical protein